MPKGNHIEPIGGYKRQRIIELFFDHNVTIRIISKRMQLPSRRIAEVIEIARKEGRVKREQVYS